MNPTTTADPGRDRRSCLLAAALAAAAQGWPVFPVVPGAKRPAVRGWETRATVDPDRIRAAWTHAPYNIGLACGPARLLVVDLDTAKPGDIVPEPWAGWGVTDGLDALTVLFANAGQPVPTGTLTVTTPSGGTHLYYAAPPALGLRNTAGALGWRIDTRAAGGYVLAPGSILAADPNRGIYQVTATLPVAPLPPLLVQHLTQATANGQLNQQGAGTAVDRPVTVDLGNGRTAGYLRSAIDAETGRVAGAQPGRRNHVLFTATVALGQLVAGGSLPEHHVRTELTRAALTAGLDQAEIAATIASGLRAGARRPRQVAA